MAQRTCTALGCSRKHDSHGLCKSHAGRARWAGTVPLKERHGPSGEDAHTRLYRIGWDVTPAGCWEWRGARYRDYGIVTVAKGRAGRAHRVSYEVHQGPIPAGMVVMHSCDNPPCVNPQHLRVGTQAENLADMRHKGRARPEGLALGRRGRAQQLSDDAVREIRHRCAAGESQTLMAREFDVSSGYINNIVHRRARASVI